MLLFVKPSLSIYFCVYEATGARGFLKGSLDKLDEEIE